MQRILSTGLETMICAVVLIPVFLYLHKVRFHNKKYTVSYTLFALYLSAIYAVAGLPNIIYLRFNPHFNFVPFAYMFSDGENSLLNVILFVPLGIFLPLLWKKYKSAYKTILFGFFTSVFIEAMQIFTFRATDINDLMTNTLGTALGYFISWVFLKRFPSTSISGENKDLPLLLGTVFAIMFFAHPFLSQLLSLIIL